MIDFASKAVELTLLRILLAVLPVPFVLDEKTDKPIA